MSENNTDNPRITVTIPAMDELGFIDKCIESIKEQTYKNFCVIVCVNQPEAWWYDAEKKPVCKRNRDTISYLKSIESLPVEVIDRSSTGKGFTPAEKGVGHARNILFDKALSIAGQNDLIMCLDADTIIEPGYLQSVADVFSQSYTAVALANPYYHNLTGNESNDRAMLRYEIYMRLYVLNLWRIGSPYAFTPLGSAITVKAKSLKAIGKIAAKSAGEDFYLLQKLRKHGRIIQYNNLLVYPSSRPSARVPFGTGPAVLKGVEGIRERYPIYPVEPFNLIGETYRLFPELFKKDVPTPMDVFFERIFGTRKIFQSLRNNCKTRESFIRACHIKIDGLRILQFIKHYNNTMSDEYNLKCNLNTILEKSEISPIKCFFSAFKFENISIPLLQNLRNILANKELIYRKVDFYEPKMSF